MTRSSSAATATACCSKVGIKRGPWTAEEDEVLARFVRKEGEGRWRTLPKRAGLLRCGKSCRLRWMNYLRPSVKRGHISPDEEDLILRLHRLLGNRWSLIAGRIPGRTDNEIKNYWNTHLSKKLISQGIDPRTHRPFKPNSIAKPSSSSSSFKPSDPTLALIPNPYNKKLTKQPPSESHDHHHHNQADDDHLSNNNNDDVQVTTTNDATLLHHHPIFENDTTSIDFIPSSHHHHLGTNEQADDHLNYCCSDEVFSSFLNSLINDDDDVAFAAAVTNSQLPVVSAADDHPFLSVNANNVWESAIVTSSSFNQINDDDPVG